MDERAHHATPNFVFNDTLPPALGHYFNARVTVHYMSGVQDTGVLTYLDRSWAELFKDNGERLLIPVGAIRILKMVKPAETSEDAAMLLRASDAQPKKQISTDETSTKQIGPR